MSDSKIIGFLTTLWDIMYMGILWMLFSLPIVTIGASTTALYYVATKKVTDREGTYMIQDFWQSFKGNFVQSTITFWLLAVVGFAVWANFMLLDQMDLGSLAFIIRLALAFVAIQLLFIFTAIFAVIARFDLKLMPAFKASFALTTKHLLSTIINVVFFLIMMMLGYLIPVMILFAMGIHAYFSSILLVRIFKQNNTEFEEHLDGSELEINDEI